MGSERRSSPRFRFIAEAEVIETANNSMLKARTHDLSIGGCFLDTLNPLAKGTGIQVRIVHAGAVFTACGRVAFVVPNMGMGVAFTKLDSNQILVLQEWLLVVSRLS